ncbi:MAG: hypoxanthine phosphoribosyltransferase [Clostridia bacterium]|jgi:hypoxanthine phosphoribosyltransferase|nr:hypoxanthine phosphoribosyltransferase [Clostridia bacterium]MBR5257583.1 hypoxanthine phosphoribosyltransferase [Clostridia bacterium]
MLNDMSRILLTRDQIAKRVSEIGREMTEMYKNDDRPLFVCVLKGSIVFFADLIRAVSIPLDIEFMTASSYGAATVSSGEVKVVSALDEKIKGRNVVLVEDIIDSGRTIAYIKNDMLGKGVKTLRVVTLLDKPSRRVADVSPDISGFEVPDEFVVGYGLDYDQKYRNFPDIGVLKPEIYGG